MTKILLVLIPALLLVLVFYRILIRPDEDRLLEEVVRYAKKHQAIIMSEGRELTPKEREVALELGIRDPDEVRIMLIDGVPEPESRFVRRMMNRMGIRASRSLAITLGYGIYLTPGGSDAVTIAHELAHVAQVDRLGGVEPFMEVYLDQLAQFGYRDAAFEVEAFRMGARYGHRLQ